MTKVFLLSMDSARLFDPQRCRIRKVGGLRPPTTRETNGWRRLLQPPSCVSGEPTKLVWEIDRSCDPPIERATLTSPFVVELPLDPTVGPWSFVPSEPVSDSSEDENATQVVRSTDGLTVHTLHPTTGWLLSCFLNVAGAWDVPAAPTPMFDVADTDDEAYFAVIAADHPVAVGTTTDVEEVVSLLRLLPHDITLPMALRGAAASHGWHTPVPIWRTDSGTMIRALIAAGLTDQEVEDLIAEGTSRIEEVVRLACAREGDGHPWVEVGTWLRHNHLHQTR